ncbi:MAG: hypothetical protein MJ189_01180, partial [Coriobacteriales bacterium]|nr:hypothetical protein [Coriobacteriales bacterium]
LCKHMKVQCKIVKCDVAAMQKDFDGGLENCARIARHKIAQEELYKLCEEQNCNVKTAKILCAHTLDDRIETFYMRSLVGTGPGGLSSIHKLNGHVYRPFLDVKKETLREFVRKCAAFFNEDGKLWCEDTTNFDRSNFRSILREDLMPVLEQIRPSYKNSLKNTMNLIEDEDRYLDELAKKFIALNFSLNKSMDGLTAQIDRTNFIKLDKIIKRRVLKQCIECLNNEARVESQQIIRIIENENNIGYSTVITKAIEVTILKENIEICA